MTEPHESRPDTTVGYNEQPLIHTRPYDVCPHKIPYSHVVIAPRMPTDLEPTATEDQNGICTHVTRGDDGEPITQ
jgi:hypothetical protein